MKRRRFDTYYERCVLPLRNKYRMRCVLPLRKKYRKEQRPTQERVRVPREVPPGAAASYLEERECDRRELLERKLCVLEELLANQETRGPQENIAQLFYVAVEIGQEAYLTDLELVMRVAKAQILAEELRDRFFPQKKGRPPRTDDGATGERTLPGAAKRR